MNMNICDNCENSDDVVLSNVNLCSLNEITEPTITDTSLLRFPVCYDNTEGYITFETLNSLLGLSLTINDLAFTGLNPNPTGGDTGDNETFTITNVSGNNIDLSQFTFGRFLISGQDPIYQLSGILNPGNSITLPSNPSGPSVLNNVLGGVLFLAVNNDIYDVIAYPPTPIDDTLYNYAPVPNNMAQRQPL